MDDLANYLSPAAFHSTYSNIVGSENSLRWLIRHRDVNGLSDAGAVVKRQGRIYLHVQRFAGWMSAGA
jgi:hypothetical protein